jgi:hypothetical protein
LSCSSLFAAIDHGCFDCLKLLLSKKDVIEDDGERGCAIYRTLLTEIYKHKNIDMFELLIKENPFDCLNKPMRYPIKQVSDLMTVLDSCSFKLRYSDSKDEREFYEKSIAICKQYGAKTLEELVQEGYVMPRKPENPYARHFPGYIED